MTTVLIQGLRGGYVGYRKIALANGCFYHVFKRSIAEFTIFRMREEFLRMREVIRYYLTAKRWRNFSTALKLDKTNDEEFHGEARVRILAYCLMPTHVHLFLEQKERHGISDFMRFISNSYSSYFNVRIKRKGPLWESVFEAKLVETDEYALHLSRYIHLNPTSAGLVARPEDWEFSSYHEYLRESGGAPFCDFHDVIPIQPALYRKFTEDRQDYQRSLQIIKSILID